MSDTILRAYPGPPDAAWVALQRDADRLRVTPTDITWTGLLLIVVFEKRGPDLSRLGADAVRVLGAIGATLLFAYAGLYLVTLRSQAGNTVAEAFYQGVGLMSWALALLTLAIGFKR